LSKPPLLVACLTNSRSTPRTSRCTARPVAVKGGSNGGDRPLARRPHEQGPRAGRRSRQANLVHPDTGNSADIAVAPTLLDTAAPPRRLLGDKAYDTDAFRALLAVRQIEAVIPSSARRTRACPLNRIAYRRRNLIERMFCRLKDWRRIATRYDRLADNFLSAIALVATICFWC
jgi:transposase